MGKKTIEKKIKANNFILPVMAIMLLFSACLRKNQKVDFYENLFTNELISAADFRTFQKNIVKVYSDSTGGKANITFILYSVYASEDLAICPFKYDVRVGKNYIVQADDSRNQKIDMKVEPHILTSIKGDFITVGGIQSKPTMINLWFIACPGCVAEMPTLNELKKKYADKVNFIAITFEEKKRIESFLTSKKFDFTHISNAEDFIKYIGTKPYPESIFIDRNG